jgi:hypothetical protein
MRNRECREYREYVNVVIGKPNGWIVSTRVRPIQAIPKMVAVVA